MTTINLGKIKPLYKGAYSGGVTYRPLDFTLYFGNLYICKAPSTGNPPTDTAYFDPVISINAAVLPNTPYGSIAATTVQDAINELDAEKVAKTDVIAIAKGGTGATTANAAADAIGAFRRGTLLGTVSQSAGVPTGAVIERGSNANGQYVRFADGTQICTYSAEGNEILSTAYAGIFVSGAEQSSKPFPAAFVGAPVRAQRATSVTAGVSLPGPLSRFVVGQNWSPQQAYALTNVGTIYVVHEYSAVGRWF